VKGPVTVVKGPVTVVKGPVTVVKGCARGCRVTLAAKGWLKMNLFVVLAFAIAAAAAVAIMFSSQERS